MWYQPFDENSLRMSVWVGVALSKADLRGVLEQDTRVGRGRTSRGFPEKWWGRATMGCEREGVIVGCQGRDHEEVRASVLRPRGRVRAAILDRLVWVSSCWAGESRPSGPG